MLPSRCDVAILRGSWEIPPIFRILADRGGVAEAELYQVFNMGIGMVLIVADDQADAVLRALKVRKQSAWLIGEVQAGTGKVQLV